MGYARGSSVIETIWGKVREYVPEERRAEVLQDVIFDFAKQTDWDTEDEIENIWPESKKALELYWKKWERIANGTEAGD